MDSTDKDLIKFDFSISLFFLFNPKLLPKVPKPSESDYQDTKLLYYYPEDSIPPEEKRNQVGLTEGSYNFFGFFSLNPENNAKTIDDFPLDFNEELKEKSFKKDEESTKDEYKGGFQIIYLDDYIHILKEIEKDLWLFFVIKPFSLQTPIKTIENEYLNVESFSYDETCFNEENCKKFINHFYQSFLLFYGNFGGFFDVEENKMNKEFHVIMRSFIRSYLSLNSHYGGYLNILKYNFTGVNYSPIDKKKFLSMQYLINILQNIEKKLEHFALFFSGYFVFSTFELKDLQLLYDYFYITYNSCEIDLGKIANRFEKFEKNDKNNKNDKNEKNEKNEKNDKKEKN